MQQTALHFEFQSNQSLSNFYAGGNSELLALLQSMLTPAGEQQVFIWGESGVGKTHLLHALAQQARQQNISAFYLDFNALSLPPIGVLEGLEDMELVCLDNLHNLAEHPEWQEALFGFYNRHRHNNHRLLVAADAPPKYLPFGLMDLKTRMGWGVTVRIKPLRDDQLIAALTYKAHDLGFDIPSNVGRFLLNHFAQDQAALWQLLSKIDRATLIEQRRLTIPFMKRILQTD